MNHEKKVTNSLIFFCAFILSAFGFEFMMFIMTVHIYKLTGSPLDVGIFTTVAFLPRIFSQYYGVMIDKYNKKLLFAFSCLIIAYLIVMLSLTRNINVIYILWFFISFFAIIILTVRTASLTDVVSKHSYIKGNATALTMLNAAKLIAPLVGGLIASTMGIAIVLYFTSAIYIIAFCFIMFLTFPSSKASSGENISTINEQIIEGLRYMFNEPILCFFLSLIFSWRLFFGLQASLFVVYVQSYLNLGAQEYGIFMTCVGVGSLLGGFLGLKISHLLDGYKVLLCGLSVHYLSFCLLGIFNSYYLAIVILIISYASLYMSVVSVHTIRDNTIKSDLRGRVIGSVTAIVAAPAIISMIAGGFLAEQYGVQNVFICVGILGFLSLIGLYYYYSRRYKLINQDV